MGRARSGIGVLAVAVVALALAACGGSDKPAPPVITDRSLSDSLGVAVNKQLEDRGFFGTRVSETAGRCKNRGGPNWICLLSIAVNDQIRDLRTYRLTIDSKGCWVAVQTGTDIGGTGSSSRPENPDRVKGCV